MLQESGADVVTITRRTVRLDNAHHLAACLQGCDALIHTAFDAYDETANLAIADTIGAVCAAQAIRLVHISTAAVYEPLPDGIMDETASTELPGTAYQRVKRAIEARLLAAVSTRGLNLVILQPTIVYGPYGGAWTDSPIRELLTGTVPLPNSGQGLCNAVYVDDVCRAAMAACSAAIASGERILVSGAAPVTWRDFLGAYETILGTHSLQLEPPGRAAVHAAAPRAAASLARRLRGMVLSRLGAAGRSRLNLLLRRLRTRIRGRAVYHASGAKRALYESQCVVSIDKARRLLAYAPAFDLRAGMAATGLYVRQNYVVRKKELGGQSLSPQTPRRI